MKGIRLEKAASAKFLFNMGFPFVCPKNPGITLPETNKSPWKIHHFDGIYQFTMGFSWAMLVSGRVPQNHSYSVFSDGIGTQKILFHREGSGFLGIYNQTDISSSSMVRGAGTFQPHLFSPAPTSGSSIFFA